MKGDGNIKILRFIGAGYNNTYQVKIKIYHNNELIFEGITYNGKIEVCLKENEIYKIETCFLNKITSTYLYVRKKSIYTFILEHTLYKTITISLVDFYYNLPIKRGEIFLWQRQ